MLLSPVTTQNGRWGEDDMMLDIDHIMDGVCLSGLIVAPLYLIYKLGLFLAY